MADYDIIQINPFGMLVLWSGNDTMSICSETKRHHGEQVGCCVHGFSSMQSPFVEWQWQLASAITEDGNSMYRRQLSNMNLKAV